jgi:AraC family transcriptional regulator
MQTTLRGPIDRRRVRGGLAGWQLARATEHIEARLSSTIKMDEVAQLIGLSTSQFARAFRRSIGMPPHRWHLNARIRHAQQLMFDTDLPLAEIALESGFADQSHFANTFTRLVGISPGVWRREQRLGLANPPWATASAE